MRPSLPPTQTLSPDASTLLTLVVFAVAGEDEDERELGVTLEASCDSLLMELDGGIAPDPNPIPPSDPAELDISLAEALTGEALGVFLDEGSWCEKTGLIRGMRAKGANSAGWRGVLLDIQSSQN